MDWDRIWKWVERAATILVAIGTLVIAYYTTGLFYGWDKVPKGGGVAAPSGTMTPLWPLIVLAVLTGLLFITAWIMIFLRKGKKTEIVSKAPALSQIDDYSDDPEAEATDKQAYREILAFAWDQMIPACEAQVKLQNVIISQAGNSNPVMASLACMGLRHSDRTKEFWNHYEALSAGLLASPGPLIKFEAIIEHIAALENENYRVFSEQMNEFAIIFSMNVRTDANLRPVWVKWVEAHNALVTTYDTIKRDPRFGKLLRPARPSRWGSLIEAHDLETLKTVLEVSGPHFLPDHVGHDQWRFRVHNRGPTTAANVQMRLRNIDPRPKYGRWQADYPYPVIRVGKRLDEPPSRINVGDEEDYEVKTWRGSDGNFYASLNTKDIGPLYMVAIEPSEVWELKYELTAENADQSAFPCK